MKNDIVTAEDLRTFLHYDPETGDFTWLKQLALKVKIGSIAGSHQDGDHTRIRIKGRKYLAHRLAWLYTHGKWPQFDIDHINGDPADNRLCNLRDVTRRTNLENFRKATAGNKTSGFLGVSWYAQRGKWRAEIRIGGKNKYLGLFDDPALAHEAYLAAKRKLHPGCTI